MNTFKYRLTRLREELILDLNTFNWRNPMAPGWRLLIAIFGPIYLLKAVALTTRRGPDSVAGWAAFLFV